MSQPTQSEIDKATVRRKAVKAYADMVYPQSLAVVLNAVMDNIQKEGNVEAQRALRVSACRTAADIAITAGIAFVDKWNDRKGEFSA